jgi:hypothetical protein
MSNKDIFIYNVLTELESYAKNMDMPLEEQLEFMNDVRAQVGIKIGDIEEEIKSASQK